MKKIMDINCIDPSERTRKYANMIAETPMPCIHHNPCSFGDDYLCVMGHDKQTILCAVKDSPCRIEFADDNLLADQEVILAAVKNDGSNLSYASDCLKNNKAVVMAAINNDGLALEYARASLRADKEVVLAAVAENGLALQHVNLEGLNNTDVFSHVIEREEYKKKFGTFESYELNKEIVMTAVKNDGCALQYASTALKNDKEVVLTAVQQNGWALYYASDDLKQDRDVVLSKVKNFARSIEETLCKGYDLHNELVLKSQIFSFILENKEDDSFVDNIYPEPYLNREGITVKDAIRKLKSAMDDYIKYLENE